MPTQKTPAALEKLMKATGPLTDAEWDLLKSFHKRNRSNGVAQKGFDYDLSAGALRERAIKDLLCSAKIEIKADKKAGKTGNICVEEMSRGKESGITTTEADWWCFVLAGPEHDDEVAVFVRTERLKKIVADSKVVYGGDGRTSKLRIVPLTKLFATNEELNNGLDD